MANEDGAQDEVR